MCVDECVTSEFFDGFGYAYTHTHTMNFMMESFLLFHMLNANSYMCISGYVLIIVGNDIIIPGNMRSVR